MEITLDEVEVAVSALKSGKVVELMDLILSTLNVVA